MNILTPGFRPCFRLRLLSKETGSGKLVTRYSSATVPDSHGIPHLDSHCPKTVALACFCLGDALGG
jgi:hypothetical protein